VPAVAATPDPVAEGVEVVTGSVARHRARSLRRAGLAARARWRPRRGGWTVALRRVDGGGAPTDLTARAAEVTGAPFVELSGRPTVAHLEPTTELLWARARRSQGPIAARARVVDAVDVRFRFVRTLPDGRTIAHRYERRGNWTSVAYHPVGAPGEAVRIIASEAGATLHQPGEPPSEVSTSKAAEVLAAFAPQQVLRPILALPEVMSSPVGAVAQPVAAAGNGPVTFALGAGAGSDQVHVDRTTGWVIGAGMRSEAGLVELSFEGRAADTAVPLPRRITTRRDGEVIDDVVVLELTLESRPDSSDVGRPGS